MKEDLINLIATYTALGEAITYLIYAAVLVIVGCCIWLGYAIGRRILIAVLDSFDRANQLIDDIQQPHPAVDTEHARIPALARKESS